MCFDIRGAPSTPALEEQEENQIKSIMSEDLPAELAEIEVRGGKAVIAKDFFFGTGMVAIDSEILSLFGEGEGC